jgi:uncharacterized protein (TIGR02145 family)
LKTVRSKLLVLILGAVFGIFFQCKKEDDTANRIYFAYGHSMVLNPVNQYAIAQYKEAVIHIENPTFWMSFNMYDLKPGQYSLTTKSVTQGNGNFFAHIGYSDYNGQFGILNITSVKDGFLNGNYSVKGFKNFDSVASFEIKQGILENVPFTRIQYDSIADFEGNQYPTVNIGTQTWMAENLRSTKYVDGTDIPHVSPSIWQIDTSLSGKYYTWKVCMNGETYEMAQGLCPAGWHIPTVNEWQTLFDYVGIFPGLHLSSIKSSQSVDIDNSSGFSAFPAGHIEERNGLDYRNMGYFSEYWTSSPVSDADSTGYLYQIPNDGNNIYKFVPENSVEATIRCIKNK